MHDVKYAWRQICMTSYDVKYVWRQMLCAVSGSIEVLNATMTVFKLPNTNILSFLLKCFQTDCRHCGYNSMVRRAVVVLSATVTWLFLHPYIQYSCSNCRHGLWHCRTFCITQYKYVALFTYIHVTNECKKWWTRQRQTAEPESAACSTGHSVVWWLSSLHIERLPNCAKWWTRWLTGIL